MNSRFQQMLVAMTGCAMLMLSMGAVADGKDVSFDAGTNFKALKTFVIRDGQITSYKAEIDNPLFRQRMEASIRAALVKKGLTEVADQADVRVTYYFYDKDVSAVGRQAPVPQGFGNPGPSLAPVMYTEGTLVIDFFNASNSLLWRGTWRDTENGGPRLSRKLSEDARKLLAMFPPKQK